MIKGKLLFPVALFLCITSCSPRYIKYQRAVKKLHNNEISLDEFDKQFYTFYKEKENRSLTDSTALVKFNGAYVSQGTGGGYSVYKFFPNGKAFSTYKMDTYPDNISILNVLGEQSYFRVSGNNVEYLMSRDWNLYNIIKSATVHNDTLTFFESRYAKSILSNPSDIHEMYVYDSTLTALPYWCW